MDSLQMAEPIAPEVSTQIDAGSPTDPAQALHKEEIKAEEPKKTETRIDALKRAEADLEVKVEPSKDEKADAKPDVDAKPDPKVEAVAKPDAEPKVDEKTENRAEAPKNFLPQAKELWKNTPRAVQAEVDRVFRERDAEVAELTQKTARYSELQEFDDLARSNGRDLRDSLAKMSEIEDALQSNPIAGLNKILMEIGPRKADGQPVSLFELATFISEQGQQGYQQIVSQQPQQQAQPNREVETLRAELQGIKTEMAAKSIIEPFAQQNPRYFELQDDIAMFLQSGKIPPSLTPADRLAAAYDMAERINPSSMSATPARTVPDTDRLVSDLNGTKSVKGAPLSGVDTQSRRTGRLSRNEALDAAFSELGLS